MAAISSLVQAMGFSLSLSIRWSDSQGFGISRDTARPDGALLDVLDPVAGLDQALDEDARGDDVVGVQFARLDNYLRLGNGQEACRGHHRVEIPGGVAVDE